jgi:tripartite-type tricarboxylate transporter receptor subunit TctC
MVTLTTGAQILVLAAAVCAWAPGVVQAQARFPERPIRLVVPFAAGGGGDIVARKIAHRVAPLLGQQVVVENIAGAGGAIGAADVARSKPDGHTLLLAATSTHAINPAIMEKLAYHPVKDYAPIAMVATIPTALGMHPSVPARDLRELVTLVRRSPDKLSYASTGSGSINHFAGELFKRQAGGLRLLHIPYRGTAQSVQEVIGGQVPLVVATFSAMLQQHRAGRLLIPALFHDRRMKIAPDVRTAIEQGTADMVAYSFSAIVAPAGTPASVVDQLHKAISAVMSDAAFQKELEDLAIDPIADSSPARAARQIADEIARWSPVARAVGVKG